MSNALKIAPPPRRTIIEAQHEPEAVERPDMKPIRAMRVAPAPAPKFSQVKEDERVQFNKRVTRGVADGFEMLAIRTRTKVPELLAEALELLEQRYGKIS